MPQNLEDPFRAIDQVIADLNAPSDQPHTRSPLIVDFHAEATAEKQAMGWHVAGRVSALFGTHTHVATADQRILPGQTGYVTDLGMVGPLDSVIGAPIDSSVRRFLTQRPARGKVPEGPVIFNAVLFVLHRVRGTCLAIERLDRIDGSSGADRTHA